MAFIDKARALATTAAKIAKLRGEEIEATILEKAAASLIETGYDNWDGGRTFHTLMLDVPIPTFAAIENQRLRLEKSILRRISQLVRTETADLITEVVISPILADESRPKEEPSEGLLEEEIPSFWQPGFFRLFITHIAANKASAHRLKEALARFQIAAFVAHDDIEPTKEWQAEIERALRTMDALAAIIAPGFVQSLWCDQEVGIAIGRGKLVIPLRAGSDPHGFLSKYQALLTQGLDASGVAEKIVGVLTQHPLSAQRMAEALVDRMVTSPNWDSSKFTIALLERVPRLNASQMARLVQAIDDNPQVGKAFGVPERIRSLIARVGERTP